MLKAVDNWLNRVTMYRLVLYFLIVLLGAAVALSYVRVLNFDPIALLFSAGLLLAVCGITNWIFARAFGAITNSESAWISALILALIITPPQSGHDLWFLFWAGVLAMASKYIVAIGRKHLFNPVAFAVAVTYLTANQSASWWVGSGPMLPSPFMEALPRSRSVRTAHLQVRGARARRTNTRTCPRGGRLGTL